MDIDKLERMADDIITHKIYVLQICQKVFKYLCDNNQSQVGIDLLKRAATHDNSKFSESEFERMASILKTDECFKNAKYKLSKEERDIIRLHWKNNRHHPEHFNDINQMSDLDIWEMVCDWYARSLQYGTNFLEFVSTRQKNRFDFPEQQFEKIYKYCITVNEICK